MCRYQNINLKQPNLQSLMSRYHQKISYSFSFFHLTIIFLRLTSLNSLTLFHISLVTEPLDNIYLYLSNVPISKHRSKQPNLQSLISRYQFPYSFSFFPSHHNFPETDQSHFPNSFHISLVTEPLDNISTSISLSHTDSTFTHLFSVTQVPRSHRSSPFLISLKLLRSLDHTDRLLSHLSQATQVPRSHRPSPFRL